MTQDTQHRPQNTGKQSGNKILILNNLWNFLLKDEKQRLELSRWMKKFEKKTFKIKEVNLKNLNTSKKGIVVVNMDKLHKHRIPLARPRDEVLEPEVLELVVL